MTSVCREAFPSRCAYIALLRRTEFFHNKHPWDSSRWTLHTHPELTCTLQFLFFPNGSRSSEPFPYFAPNWVSHSVVGLYSSFVYSSVVSVPAEHKIFSSGMHVSSRNLDLSIFKIRIFYTYHNLNHELYFRNNIKFLSFQTTESFKTT